MTERNCAGIGDVVRLGKELELQLDLNGVLHLGLGRLTTASERLLDPSRSVSVDLNPAKGGG